MTADSWWLMGYEARADNHPYNPPELLDRTDPRALAWIDGWESADHDMFRKAQA